METARNTLKTVILSLFLGCFGSLGLAHAQSIQEPRHLGESEENFGPRNGQSWLEPWVHSHFSPREVPFVHSFNLEPAFLGRDFFLSYGSSRGAEGSEAELEVELEWAFTRRLGMILEAPLTYLNPAGTSSEVGVGDLAAAARALLVDSERFLLSGNLEVSIPSGDEAQGFGSGELGLSPSFSAWLDFGNWLQGHAQVGTAHGLDSGESEFFYGGALIYIFTTHRPHAITGHDYGHSGAHSTLGVTSGILELNGRTITDGLYDGRSTAELIVGVSYNLSKSLEVRGGYQFPVGGNQEFDSGFTLGLVHHF